MKLLGGCRPLWIHRLINWHWCSHFHRNEAPFVDTVSSVTLASVPFHRLLLSLSHLPKASFLRPQSDSPYHQISTIRLGLFNCSRPFSSFSSLLPPISSLFDVLFLLQPGQPKREFMYTGWFKSGGTDVNLAILRAKISRKRRVPFFDWELCFRENWFWILG